MRYVCLIYDDEKNWEKMPKTESDAMMGEYFAFTNDIKKNGHYHAGEALQPVATATTVRVRNGKVSPPTGRSPKPRSSSAASTSSPPAT